MSAICIEIEGANEIFDMQGGEKNTKRLKIKPEIYEILQNANIFSSGYTPEIQELVTTFSTFMTGKNTAKLNNKTDDVKMVQKRKADKLLFDKPKKSLRVIEKIIITDENELMTHSFTKSRISHCTIDNAKFSITTTKQIIDHLLSMKLNFMQTSSGKPSIKQNLQNILVTCEKNSIDLKIQIRLSTGTFLSYSNDKKPTIIKIKEEQ